MALTLGKVSLKSANEIVATLVCLCIYQTTLLTTTDRHFTSVSFNHCDAVYKHVWTVFFSERFEGVLCYYF